MIYLDIESPVGTLLIAAHSDDKSVVPGMQQHKYEPHIQQLLNEVIKPHFRCLDIGANYGQHTTLMAALAAHVCAVEASVDNVACLVHTMTINHCNNVEIFNRAIWSETKELTFSFTPTNSACSFLSTEGYHQDNEELETLEGVALDDLFDGPFDFIKMDIEGSELAALNGGTNIFGACPRLLVELNAFTCKSFMGVEIVDVIDKIMSLGYVKQYVYTKSVNPERVTTGGWRFIDIHELKTVFKNGTILIDVYFTKE